MAQEARDDQLRLADELKVAQQERASRDVALWNMSELEAKLAMTLKEVEKIEGIHEIRCLFRRQKPPDG